MPTLRARICQGIPAAVLLTLTATSGAAGIERVAEYQGAYVEFDNAVNRWQIGNEAIRLAIEIDRRGFVRLAGLFIPEAEDPVTLGRDPEGLISIDGETVRLGAEGGDFKLERVDAATGTHFVALTIRYVSTHDNLAASRRYLAYPGAAAIEMWTEVESLDEDRHVIDNLNGYAMTVPPGAIDYVTGLQTAPSEGGSFTRRTHVLGEGERLDLGSSTLSSEQMVPYYSVGDGHRRVFGGLLWSGAWSASLDRRGDALQIAVGLPTMSAWVSAGRPIEGPHAFVGVAWDVPGADISAITRFVRAGRAGRDFPALTTFNTWFVHGIAIDEDTILRDIDGAAEVGLEMFQLDAGWYPRENPENVFDFTNGLGSWQVDRDRFPSGLASLREHAHSRGLKFGVWVEPERVALTTVGRPGMAEERFLAQRDGAYSPGVANEEARDAQICLADPGARAWVLQRLTQLIDEVQPDNIKWDFNRWIHCNRPGHDHSAEGGNFEHTRGLYALLAALRERYPALTIENCSGGGNRLDFALARLTDTAWMDDRSAPSAHVRRNLQGLLAAFPASYLFSYVMADADEPMADAPDLPMMVRSRMPGVVGVATELGHLGEREKNELHQQVELAKALRPRQTTAVTYTLTSQRPGPGEWEVIQQYSAESGASLIYAFSNGAADSIAVSLRGIQPDLLYELRSSDRGRLGVVSGVDLIAGGLAIHVAPESAAQVLVLEPLYNLSRLVKGRTASP
jgi:alpha-galactosidase